MGYAQATLEDVAQEVGLNRATLYYYVGTKQELLVSLLSGPIQQLSDGIEATATLDITPTEKLAKALRDYVVTMEERPELFIFLAENIHVVMSGSEADSIQQNADRYGRMMALVVADGRRAGEFRLDVSPELAVLGILGMFNWIYRWFAPDGPRTLQEIGEEFVSMALSSLRPVD